MKFWMHHIQNLVFWMIISLIVIGVMLYLVYILVDDVSCIEEPIVNVCPEVCGSANHITYERDKYGNWHEVRWNVISLWHDYFYYAKTKGKPVCICNY